MYLSTVLHFPKDKKVYVVGMSGIEEELREEGISFLGGTVRTFCLKWRVPRFHTTRMYSGP